MFLITISQNGFALIVTFMYLMIKVLRLSGDFEFEYIKVIRNKLRKVVLGQNVKLEADSGEYEYFVAEQESVYVRGDKKLLKHNYLFNEIIFTSFVVYLIFLVSKIYFPITFSLRGPVEYRLPSIWLKPLWSLQQVYNIGGVEGFIYQIGGNLILLAPLAFYMLYFRSDKFIGLKNILMFCLKVTICIETSQVFLSLIIPSMHRYFEINDIICNTLGGILGFSIYKIFNFLLNKYGTYESKNQMIS